MVEHTATPSANRTIVDVRLKRNAELLLIRYTQTYSILNSTSIHTNHVFMRNYYYRGMYV